MPTGPLLLNYHDAHAHKKYMLKVIIDQVTQRITDARKLICDYSVVEILIGQLYQCQLKVIYEVDTCKVRSWKMDMNEGKSIPAKKTGPCIEGQ